MPGAAPQLEAVPSGAKFRLQWPADHAGYQVEATSDLAGGWTAANVSVSSNATLNYIDIDSPTSGGQRFFRLAKP